MPSVMLGGLSEAGGGVEAGGGRLERRGAGVVAVQAPGRLCSLEGLDEPHVGCLCSPLASSCSGLHRVPGRKKGTSVGRGGEEGRVKTGRTAVRRGETLG